ncbi:MAG: lipopolysaccharide biosynthesis protein [Lachnospiraceae bacterium]|nr:lipopolysaccharide biosynthesis protein [Lachnospiraceae bacterium]
MESKDLENKAVVNFIWRFLEHSGANILLFIVSVVLARILAPDLYGIVAISLTINAICRILVDGGLGNALVQKKDSDDLDFSTVFYANMAMCILLYLLMFVSSPLIAKFYRQDILVPVIRIQCTVIIMYGFETVQMAYVTKNFQFKRFFYATLVGTIVSSIIGILFAIKGFGVWSLVYQQVIKATLNVIVLWVTVKWRPKLCFSFERLKSLLGYGWKLLVSNLVDKLGGVYFQQLVFGRAFSSANLAFFNRGYDLTNTVVENVNGAADAVLFSTMSYEQDEKENLKSITKRSVMYLTYIMVPLLFGMFFSAPILIELLLGSKWLDSVFFLRIFCAAYALIAVETASQNVIKAVGKSDLVMKTNIIKRAIGIIAILCTLPFGINVVSFAVLLSTLFGQIMTAYVCKKTIGYGFLELYRDVFLNVFAGLLMGIPVLLIPHFNLSLFVTFALQALSGLLIYVGVSAATKNASFLYFVSYIKGIFKKT